MLIAGKKRNREIKAEELNTLLANASPIDEAFHFEVLSNRMELEAAIHAQM